MRRERREQPNTGAHARYTVLRVIAIVVLAHAAVEVYLSIQSGNPSKALEKMADMAMGALLGIIARTESPAEAGQPGQPPIEAKITNTEKEPVPTTTEAPGEGD